jgi:hypothetical protein
MSDETDKTAAPVHQLVGHLRELLKGSTYSAPWILNEWRTSDYLDGIEVDANAKTSIGSVFWADKPEARLIVSVINALPAMLDVIEVADQCCRATDYESKEAHMSRLYRALRLLPNASDNLAADKKTT